MLLHKLRRAMVAPEREPLKREIEIDEFLGGHEKGLKGGRARGKKVLCAVAVEVRGRGSGRLRLGVLSDASGDSLEAFAQATTEPGAIVNSDGWLGYRGFPAVGFEHRPSSPSSVVAGDEPYLPRAHRAISTSRPGCTARRGTSRRHLPAYLDECVFRHNRRRTPGAAFQTLLGLSAIHEPSSYRDIIDQAA